MHADTNDQDLVAAALGGDRTALAGIYDRYADRVHDMCLHMLRDHDEASDVCAEVFLVAFARLGQLRDPQRLRSWLFAIARHEVYRRSRRRSRTRLVEEVEQMDRLMSEQSALADEELEAGTVDAAAVVSVLRDAAAGLDERDRTVMELQLQGLDGEELAAALGTSVATGYQQVHRMKERLERSVGAVLVARQGRADCDELDRVLRDWDGTFSVLWRKRVARHVDGCEVCERRRKAIPAALFGGTAAAFPMVPVSALTAAPGSVRDRVLSEAVLSGSAVATTDGGRGWREDGFPGPDPTRRPIAALVAAAVLVLVLLGAALFAVSTEDPDEVAAIDTPATTTTTPTTTTSSLATSADAGSPTTTVQVAPAPVPPSTAAPSVATTTVPVTSPTTSVVPSPPTPPAPSSTTPPTTVTTVVPGPTVRMAFVPRVLYRPTPGFPSCGASVPLVAVAGPTAVRVQVRWSDPGGATGVVELTPVAGEWRRVVEMAARVSGPITLRAVASDAAGRTGSSASVQVPVRNCPTPG
jgi:RNA polymerase sigma factor (sigma-70 family)